MTRKLILSFAVAVVTFAAGCAPKAATSTRLSGSAHGSAKKHGHDHEHGPGPRGGVVFEIGKYHAEFKVDHGKQEATIYILDDDEKTPTPIAAEKLDLTIKTPAFSVELKPVPMDGETGGKSSRFVGKHDNLGKEQEFEGTVVAVIGGKPSEGSFKEKAEKK